MVGVTGIESLARTLGLTTRRDIYDDDAKMLICAEAVNRIRYLEEDVLRKLPPTPRLNSLAREKRVSNDMEKAWRLRRIADCVDAELTTQLSTDALTQPQLKNEKDSLAVATKSPAGLECMALEGKMAVDTILKENFDQNRLGNCVAVPVQVSVGGHSHD